MTWQEYEATHSDRYLVFTYNRRYKAFVPITTETVSYLEMLCQLQDLSFAGIESYGVEVSQ